MQDIDEEISDEEKEPLVNSNHNRSSWRPGYENRRRTSMTRTASITDHGTFLSIQVSDVEHNVPPMDNPTTIALYMCKRMVLRPYMRLLEVLGWKPVMESRLWWQKAINILHPLLVLIFILFGYLIQIAACYRRDRVEPYSPSKPWTPIGNKTTAANNTPSIPQSLCYDYIIGFYIIPDILHMAAYAYSFYVLRITENEQLQILMEKVFLSSSPTHTGYLSQAKLITSLRCLLYFGFLWVLLSLGTQIMHIIAEYDEMKLLNFSFLSPQTEAGRISLLVLMVLGILALDIVYIAVVISYCVQCSLLVFYIRGLQEKVKEKIIDLPQAVKDVSEIEVYLTTLNEKMSSAVSLLLFNFGAMVILGLSAVIKFSLPNNLTPLMYVSTLLSVSLWCVIFCLPLIQAASLSAACNSLRKLGHAIRVRPFGYLTTPDADLDSFLLYMSSIRYKAKLFRVPIYPSSLLMLIVLTSFIVLLLFQFGVIKIFLTSL